MVDDLVVAAILVAAVCDGDDYADDDVRLLDYFASFDYFFYIFFSCL